MNTIINYKGRNISIVMPDMISDASMKSAKLMRISGLQAKASDRGLALKMTLEQLTTLAPNLPTETTSDHMNNSNGYYDSFTDLSDFYLETIDVKDVGESLFGKQLYAKMSDISDYVANSVIGHAIDLAIDHAVISQPIYHLTRTDELQIPDKVLTTLLNRNEFSLAEAMQSGHHVVGDLSYSVETPESAKVTSVPSADEIIADDDNLSEIIQNDPSLADQINPSVLRNYAENALDQAFNSDSDADTEYIIGTLNSCVDDLVGQLFTKSTVSVS